MPKLNWTGDKQSGFSSEYNGMSLYLRIRGSKYAGLVLDYDREQVGGGWFVSNDGSVVENELIKRCGGETEDNTSTNKSSLENLFTITPELEDNYNQIRTDSDEPGKLYCNVCKNSVEQFNNYRKLCDTCFNKYELPVNENICVICKEENIDLSKIKMTYISSDCGFLVCVDCWDSIYVIRRDLQLVDCTKCNFAFKPCNHYEYLFKTCTSPEGYCSSSKVLSAKE